ncbi:MAG TPA: tryptophan synthase subunit alpha [Dehalococcoidia bacterium]|nr:tryptophan synthase subunit alpha [Dehalococcoidia bacterium]
MSRIGKVFTRRGHTALIAYITTGYPSIDATLKAVPILAENGCDIIELGIPFSDPLADGVTIQNASYHALQNGITPEICLELAGTLRKKVDTPLVFMSYYNPIYHYGIEKFCIACSVSGIDGLIIPDLPPEEGVEIEETTLNNGIDLIYLLAPTSNKERIRLGAEHSRGFVYLVSVIGVTGARSFLPFDLKDFIAGVRKMTNKPLCVGFGISTPEQAAQVGSLADGVIVGSRIVQLLESDDSFSRIGAFVSELRRALDIKNV